MFSSKKIKLGIAPIAWTNDDMPELGASVTFEQCISEMALAGYSGSEIGNKYPRNVDALKKALSLRNLEIVSAWFSSYLTTQPFKKTEELFIEHRDFLYEMGAKVIVVSEQGRSIQGVMDTPLFKEKPHFSDEEWRRLADGLNALGRLAKEKGMDVVYHHHMGTGVQTTVEIDKLLALTDPGLISLLFDTGHLVFSGEDPLQILDKHMSRIKHVHLKDIRQTVADQVRNKEYSFLEAVKLGAFTVPGDGDIQFDEIFARLSESGYEGWFIVEAEQDPNEADPLEYALKARRFIKEKTNL
ncbi:myo-inosose-2 dehydratase [Alteribacter populi]|uniref:myo-inosose-2 dehydratase n=1 Tax=Alteribacter populi TaxID=2011011 RepID=UPI000BBAD568|nr:myo-inosose-2 dehydratase [Alteribacter populi]